ncbi:MAG: esterase-like activity of phytase family protein [Oligoflexia bacterium]|nr:esterase-like activity of phytase family protein [Oligoflexia bacterium]
MKYLTFLLILTSSISNAEITKLRYIDDISFPTGTTFQNSEIGGLSGLSYNKNSQKLIAISDDRSQRGPSRFYAFDINVTLNKLTVKPTSMVSLRTSNGQTFSMLRLDPEGIAVTEAGRVFVSSEGDMSQIPRLNPELFELQSNGNFVQPLSVPSLFLAQPSGVQTTGIRNNLGFESLTLSPDEKNIFTATEEALLQDDSGASFARGSRIRILEYVLNDQNVIPAREFAYDIEKIPTPLGFQPLYGNNGLSEMVSLGNSEFLMLERSFVQRDKLMQLNVKVFHANCKLATDVSSIASLKVAPLTIMPCKKTQILRLETFRGLLSFNHILDNIEGMSFGPILPNGRRSLILVSDNNFNTKQHTQFMAFEVFEN